MPVREAFFMVYQVNGDRLLPALTAILLEAFQGQGRSDYATIHCMLIVK